MQEQKGMSSVNTVIANQAIPSTSTTT